jgi:hypothetical protein
MLKDYEPLKEIENTLNEEKVSESSKISILMNFKKLRERLEYVEDRLYWLEGVIDEADNEEVYVAYQKHFNLNHWSGEQN